MRSLRTHLLLSIRGNTGGHGIGGMPGMGSINFTGLTVNLIRRAFDFVLDTFLPLLELDDPLAQALADFR